MDYKVSAYSLDQTDRSARSNPRYFLLSLFLPPIGLGLVISLLIKHGLKSHQNYLMIGLILLGTTIGVFADLKLYQTYRQSRQAGQQYVYNKPLQEFKLIPAAGEGLVFSRPPEFATKDDVNTKQTHKITFVHNDSLISADSFRSNLPSDTSFLTSFDELLKNPNSPVMEKFKALPDGYLRSLLGQDKLDYTFVKPLNTAYLKNRAALINFEAAGQTQKLPMLKGWVVFALGKQSVYYFLLAIKDSDWSANQATWKKVVDSIKIDQ